MPKILRRTLLVLLFVLPLLSGCASNEAQLHDGVKTVFDTAMIPVKILVRQVDNVLDATADKN